ncbi:MAG: hypothetical protein TREMPRED_002984 [Tremellales sp. Tagirdzhanova-0007]|nr:MAG: hypothetical protein TREMPRED_002984 [Tremellales sp. Tagirdzhanova-0007]
MTNATQQRKYSILLLAEDLRDDFCEANRGDVEEVVVLLGQRFSRFRTIAQSITSENEDLKDLCTKLQDFDFTACLEDPKAARLITSKHLTVVPELRRLFATYLAGLAKRTDKDQEEDRKLLEGLDEHQEKWAAGGEEGAEWHTKEFEVECTGMATSRTFSISMSQKEKDPNTIADEGQACLVYKLRRLRPETSLLSTEILLTDIDLDQLPKLKMLSNMRAPESEPERYIYDCLIEASKWTTAQREEYIYPME